METQLQPALDTLKDRLSPDELIVAGLIFSNKAMSGLEARVVRRLNDQKDTDFALNYDRTYDGIRVAQIRIIEEVAERLGIKKARYIEIKNLVYGAETRL